MPPQPQLFGLSPPLAAGQPLYLSSTKTSVPRALWAKLRGGGCRARRAPGLWEDAGSPRQAGAHAHRPVAGVLACVVPSGGLRPGARILAIHLGPLTTRPAGVGGRASEARISTDAEPFRRWAEDGRLLWHRECVFEKLEVGHIGSSYHHRERPPSASTRRRERLTPFLALSVGLGPTRSPRNEPCPSPRLQPATRSPPHQAPGTPRSFVPRSGPARPSRSNSGGYDAR
jgi:hypothetical protein